MLTKAFLTGGSLALLAGLGVYFGAEGADALESDIRHNVRLEETELAGSAESTVQSFEVDVETIDVEAVAVEAVSTDASAKLAEALDPPISEEKPKRKWLDQYLKSKPSDEEKAESATDQTVDVEVKITPEAELATDTKPEPRKLKKIRKKMVVVQKEGDEEVVLKSEDETIQVGEDFDVEMIEDLLQKHKNAKAEVRVIKIDGKTPQAEKVEKAKARAKTPKPFDYDAVLTEARKLQVIDMRNEAVLEIIDYAIDRNDVGNAADIVAELSSPELRDTARARIAVGLARRGKMYPAFAVLEEIEIDELTAPIRLEIITALMATRAERAALRKAK